MTPTIGHNSGKSIEPGASWRRYVWAKARKELLPNLPVEVVRLRVRRAKALGLPYKTYAGIRASTGHDLIGFLFSNNAMQVLRDGQPLPKDRAEKIAALRAERIAVTHRPVSAEHLAQMAEIDAAFDAPFFTESWSDMRDKMCAILRAAGNPADRYVMIGDTAFEREWMEAARMAAYLSADRYFSTQNA